ncbi:LPXTG cell wall anchor domain-containing protein [Microbacterium sp. PRF11]|uniref:DUF7933 domain-containing protein n=1 Tax=Microbacterium sp. PRF11 TaxID=2962593 RepID=UPI002881851E|nr:LPXTG cell wall anchor domain-containing protein [Microbacterium sp. PRF11]MDT0115805.1 LPXTG cell wall anchor domain-containing protein [Microbacterium sp. PRF11]
MAASVALVTALTATPTGAAAGATATPTPTPTQTTSPTPTPTADATPAPSPTAAPVTTATAAPAQSPTPTTTASASPTPAPTTTQAPAAPAARVSATSVGILAAGQPEAPAEVWSENFDGLPANSASSLIDYPNRRYTTVGWSSGTNCTGVLLNFSAPYPNANFCPSQSLLNIPVSSGSAREVRRLADALGQVAAGSVGGSAANTPANASTTTTRANAALVNLPYTGTGTGNTTVLLTANGTGIAAAASRYYTMRMDVAAAPCGNNPPSLSLALVSGGTPLLNAFSSPVLPCSTTGAVFYTSNDQARLNALDPAISTSVRAARYTGNTAAILTPAQISGAQVRLQNTVTATGSGFGVDNLRILDVTPSLDWSFGPSTVAVGTPTTLTYTITNTSDLIAKNDWSFTNTLPAGLAVAPTPSVGGTCTNSAGTAFAVTAVAGASSIAAVGGDLAAGATSCTITVNVVASTDGTFTNGAGNVATVLNAPEATTLTVVPATRLTVRKNLPARLTSTDQFTLSVRSGTTVLGSATTTGTATGVQSAQVSRLIVDAGGTYTISEAPTSGPGLGYGSSYECSRDGTVIAVGSSRSGSLTMPSDPGAEVVCTFTNTVQQVRLACDNSLFYGITAAGALIQGDSVSGGQATVGSWANASGANALGIGAGGTSAYAVNRSTDATTVLSMLKWTSAGGFETLANTAYTPVGPNGATVAGSIVAGAIDLASGRYVFGKFDSGVFYLWSFTESAPTASRFAYLGSFSAGTGPNGNGDMAFDSRGNLYVLGAAANNSVAIFSVTAASLAAANGGTLPVSTSNTRILNPGLGNVNGLAFSPRGTAYLSNATTTYEYDPTTWTRISGSAGVDFASTDLATCNSPATVSLLKNVVGRAAAADQFQITLSDSAGAAIGSATTSGTATGRQAAQVGPFPVQVGTTLNVSEAMASGSTSVIGAYTVRLECWSDGIRVANASIPNGTFTMPDRLGANVVCTFFNSPSPVATVTVTKLVFDPATNQSAPAAGWSLGTAATATTGTATALPSEAPRQNSDASGNAVWTVLFGSAASRATLTISEVQQSRFTFVSGTCTVNGATVNPTFTTTGGVVSGSLTGIKASDTVACTLTNQAVTSLTLVKSVSFGSAAATDWTLTATAPSGSLAGPTGRTGTAAVTNVAVSPGRAYRLSETGTNAAYLQVGAWRCVDTTGAEVAVTATSDVTLRTGAAVTCTVTNATATMTLLKDVVSPTPGFQPSTWTVTATPAALTGATLPTQSRVGAAYAAGQNAASTFEVRPGHGYTLSEAPTVSGTRLSYQTLRLERLDGTTWTTVNSRTVTAPAAGQNVVYRFVNASVVGPTLPLTGGIGSDSFLLAGGLLLALAVAGAVIHRRRKGGRLTT